MDCCLLFRFCGCGCLSVVLLVVFGWRLFGVVMLWCLRCIVLGLWLLVVLLIYYLLVVYLVFSFAFGGDCNLLIICFGFCSTLTELILVWIARFLLGVLIGFLVWAFCLG